MQFERGTDGAKVTGAFPAPARCLTAPNKLTVMALDSLDMPDMTDHRGRGPA
jgi:hypothetical protein